MAQIHTAASGYWDVGSTWSGGVAPSTNDIGIVLTGHTVTIRVPLSISAMEVAGGSIIQNADITFQDAFGFPNYHFYYDYVATSSYTTNGSKTAPRTIRCVNAIPTYPLKMMVYQIYGAGAETRTLNLDYVNLVNFLPFLGNENYFQYFNDPAVTNSPIITSVLPLERDTKFIEHTIIGRSRSRVYRIADNAGAITIEGYCYWSSHFPTLIKLMKASGQRISFIAGTELGTNVSMPFCRIEGVPKFQPKKGALWCPFSITLVEDW
jgi:hypothetical protein